MRPPKVLYEEIVAVAERLHAEGKLSVRRLKGEVGGGERDRLVRAARQVRETAEAAASATEAPAQPEVTELPETVRSCLGRLETVVLSEFRSARTQEIERARLAEAAAAANRQGQVLACEARLALLHEDLEDAEAEVTRLSEVSERLANDLERERNARVDLETTRKLEAEKHSLERLTLTEALSRARDDAYANVASRASADAAAAVSQAAASSAQATAAAAGAEVDRMRGECAQLRERYEELVRLFTRAELERDHAWAELRKAVEAPGSPHEAGGSTIDPASNPRRTKRPKKQVAAEP
jgi:hypothetical protein